MAQTGTEAAHDIRQDGGHQAGPIRGEGLQFGHAKNITCRRPLGMHVRGCRGPVGKRRLSEALPRSDGGEAPGPAIRRGQGHVDEATCDEEDRLGACIMGNDPLSVSVTVHPDDRLQRPVIFGRET